MKAQIPLSQVKNKKWEEIMKIVIFLYVNFILFIYLFKITKFQLFLKYIKSISNNKLHYINQLHQQNKLKANYFCQFMKNNNLRTFANTTNVVNNVVKQIIDIARKEYQLRLNVKDNMSNYSCSKVAVSINQLTTSVFNNPENNDKFKQQADLKCMPVDNMMPSAVQVTVVQKSKSNNTSRISDTHRTNRTNRSRNKKIIKNESHQKVTQIQQIIKENQQKNQHQKSIKRKFQLVNHAVEQKQDQLFEKFRQIKIEQQKEKQKEMKKKKSSSKVDRNSLLSFDYDGKHIKIQSKPKSHLISFSTDARPNRASITQIKTRQVKTYKVKNCKTIKNQEQMNSTYQRIRPKRSAKIQQEIEQVKYQNYEQKNYTEPSVWMMDSPISSGIKVKFEKRTFDNSQKKHSIKDIRENIKSRRLSKLQYAELKSLQRKYSQKKKKYTRILKTSESEPNINYDLKSQKNQKQNRRSLRKCYDFKPITAISKSQKIIVNSFILKQQLTQIQVQKTQKSTNLKSQTQFNNSQIQLGIHSKLQQIEKLKNSSYTQSNSNNNKLVNFHLANQKFKAQTFSNNIQVQNMANILKKQSAKLHNYTKQGSIFISSKNPKKLQMLKILQKKQQNQNKI